MNSSIGVGLLQAAPEPSMFSMLLPMAAIFGIFYFLLIRPQQKRQRQQQDMLKAIEKGDAVVTSGGIHGQVSGVTDDVLTVDVGSVKGERVRVKIARARIDSVEKARTGNKA